MNFVPNPMPPQTELHQQYQMGRRIRIENVLSKPTANDLAAHIYNGLDYTNAYVDGNEFKLISNQELTALGPEKQQALTKSVYRQAAEGHGFFYAKHQIQPNNDDTNLAQQFLRWLNSAELLSFIQTVTGATDIVRANAQATKYLPGHFLTRHNDVHTQQQRRVAYVFSLSPKWHPDWGGLLQFYEPSGRPLEAWCPSFNSLALFDVDHPHSVTYVAPFARAPRLSITGWFLASMPDK